MITELVQTNYATTRIYTLSDDKLTIYIKNYFIGQEDFSLPYEEITGEFSGSTFSNTALLVIAVVIFLVTTTVFFLTIDNGHGFTVFIYFYLLSAAIYATYRSSFKSNIAIKLSDGNQIEIFDNKPDQDTVKEFLKELTFARNIFLKKNYILMDPYINYGEQLDNLKWLLRMDVLTQDEYDEKYNELKSLFNPEKNQIGFGKN